MYAAKAEYRSAVVNAVQNAADVLHAIDTDGRALSATAAAELAATRKHQPRIRPDAARRSGDAPLPARPAEPASGGDHDHIDARADQYSDTVARCSKRLAAAGRRRADVKPVEGHAGSCSIL